MKKIVMLKIGLSVLMFVFSDSNGQCSEDVKSEHHTDHNSRNISLILHSINPSGSVIWNSLTGVDLASCFINTMSH
jgi:hypothetical protein